MPSQSTRLLIAAAMFTLAHASTAMAQSEVEPNNSIAQANVLASPNITVTGTYPNNTDLDYFRFVLTETSAVSIRVWGPTVGVCPSGGVVDPLLTLFNSGGQQLATNDDAGTLCPLLDSSTAPVMGSLPPGTYYVQNRSLTVTNPPQAYSLVISAGAAPVPLTQSFSYQGKLDNAGAPVNGAVPMRFSLWNSATSAATASRVAPPILLNSVNVIEGRFTVGLDFTIPSGPAIFDGSERFLQIEVGDLNGGGGFTTLAPRQRLAPTPHAIYALSAGNAARATLADNATNATNATNAVSATFATSASTASNVLWIDVEGKPAGFADNVDNTGGWTEAATTITTGLNVGIGVLPGNFDFAVNGTAAKTGGGSWSVLSDERLKRDIKPMAGTLDRLLRLRGYTYEYNDDVVASRAALPGTQIGLLAQEVERVFPDWVGLDQSGFRYVTERSTTALMVEALRDLRAEKDRQIDALKADASKRDAEAARRDAENAELRMRLERLERAADTRGK